LNKKKYEFNGYLVNSTGNSLNPDTLLLPKHPDKVTIVDANTIKITMPNIHYLIKNNDAVLINNKNLSTVNLNINNDLPATVEGNTIKIKNVTITINGVSDKYGNKFNSLYEVEMFQFREFFVNEILDKNYQAPRNSVLINNAFPLYKQNPRVIDDFWEHFNYPIITPLKQNNILLY